MQKRVSGLPPGTVVPLRSWQLATASRIHLLLVRANACPLLHPQVLLLLTPQGWRKTLVMDDLPRLNKGLFTDVTHGAFVRSWTKRATALKNGRRVLQVKLMLLAERGCMHARTLRKRPAVPQPCRHRVQTARVCYHRGSRPGKNARRARTGPCCLGCSSPATSGTLWGPCCCIWSPREQALPSPSCWSTSPTTWSSAAQRR